MGTFNIEKLDLVTNFVLRIKVLESDPYRRINARQINAKPQFLFYLGYGDLTGLTR